MTEQTHPISGSSNFLLKRWTKYSIYSKIGPYVRTTYVKSGSYGYNEAPRTNTPTSGTFIRESNAISDNLYQTNSIYLYDYVVVSDKWFYENVYTSSYVDNTPSLESDRVGSTNTWNHRAFTFKNSPNATVNNYTWRYNAFASIVLNRPVYGYTPLAISPDPVVTNMVKTPIIKDDGVYFEIVVGYPRNHFTHKRDLFSLFYIPAYDIGIGPISNGAYVRNRQLISTTIGQDGLEDGSAPIQSIQVGNLNLIQTDNVINK